MESDKISKMLEVHLKTLGTPLRRKILKNLYISNGILSFSKLKKLVLSPQESKNLSFHLNKLKKCDLISTYSEGYKITDLGINMYETIKSMKDILNENNKSIMIRTSKYSKEQFNINKIESYLIEEGQMEPFQAKKIANIVKQRLTKTNIKYLTAPLMREYINAILIEHNLENVRHRLTRLGTPPSDVQALFNQQDQSPDNFLHRLGSDVSEQYLLLNVLPKNLADLYLSGKILLANLNQWHLKPLGLFFAESDLMHLPQFQTFLEKSKQPLYKIVIQLQKLHSQLFNLSSFFSEDLLIQKYNQNILYPLYRRWDKEKIRNFLSEFADILLYESKSMNPALSFGFSFSEQPQEAKNNFETAIVHDLFFIEQMNRKAMNFHKKKGKFHFLIDYNLFDGKEIYRISKQKEHSLLFEENVIFQKPSLLNSLTPHLINASSLENHGKDQQSQIILDKIYLNLTPIARSADHDDDLFFDLLLVRLNELFDFFSYKEMMVEKKLKQFTPWKKFLRIMKLNPESCINQSLKSVSFLNLNEAVKLHCGIELDRVAASEHFALKILSFLQNILDDKNEKDKEHFILSSPHNFPKKSIKAHFPITNSMMDLLRKESTLAFQKKIDLFRKFQDIIKGGIGFPIQMNQPKNTLQNIIKQIKQSKLEAFYFSRKR